MDGGTPVLDDGNADVKEIFMTVAAALREMRYDVVACFESSKKGRTVPVQPCS